MHGLSLTQSGVLLDRAFDHLTGICNPLEYTSILTNIKIIKVRLWMIIKSFMFIIRSFVFTAPIIHLNFSHSCHSYILSHCFCIHKDLLRFPALTPAPTVSMRGSGDLYSSVWFHMNSQVLHSAPALSWLFHPKGTGSSPCRPVSLTSVLSCFSIFQSSVWLWCSTLEVPLFCGLCPHGQHLHHLSSFDESHHLQWRTNRCVPGFRSGSPWKGVKHFKSKAG